MPQGPVRSSGGIRNSLHDDVLERSLECFGDADLGGLSPGCKSPGGLRRLHCFTALGKTRAASVAVHKHPIGAVVAQEVLASVLVESARHGEGEFGA